MHRKLLLKQIFHNKHHLTKYTSKSTSKTLDFLSDVHKEKYKGRKSPENRRSSEAIQVRMDMSHMRRVHLSGSSLEHYYNKDEILIIIIMILDNIIIPTSNIYYTLTHTHTYIHTYMCMHRKHENTHVYYADMEIYICIHNMQVLYIMA